tara:strand:+ start:428 stop:871 length:444 start_codon:yes stop_codon:yes gene_type:complete
MSDNKNKKYFGGGAINTQGGINPGNIGQDLGNTGFPTIDASKRMVNTPGDGFNPAQPSKPIMSPEASNQVQDRTGIGGAMPGEDAFPYGVWKDGGKVKANKALNRPEKIKKTKKANKKAKVREGKEKYKVPSKYDVTDIVKEISKGK